MARNTAAGSPTVNAPAGSKAFTAPTVGTSAILVLAANAARISAVITNNGSATIYLGKDGTILTTTGIPLATGASLADGDSADAWWGISGSSGQDVRVLECS